MRIRDLHNKLGLLGTTHFTLSTMKGIVGGDKQSLARPAFIEALLKHPYLPKNFGEAFDRIMSPDYGLEDAKAHALYDSRRVYSPEARLLAKRAQIQSQDIISLMDEAEKWIETKDSSYKHQGNLESFRKSFQEFFDKGDAYDYGWDRLATALKTLIEEELLPAYPKSEQLRQRCGVIVGMLDPEKAPIESERSKLIKELDDLQWYFDNFCVGMTVIEDVGNGEDISEPLSIPVLSAPQQAPEEAVFAMDGKLMALPDGAVYIKDKKASDIEPCVGQTLYALISKKAGYVTYLDIAKIIYGEHTKAPADGRKAAIRKYVSTLKAILKRYFPVCDIENERGKGWTFVEHARIAVAVS